MQFPINSQPHGSKSLYIYINVAGGGKYKVQ